jgi:transcription initiation factor TFIID subunit 11
MSGSFAPPSLLALPPPAPPLNAPIGNGAIASSSTASTGLHLPARSALTKKRKLNPNGKTGQRKQKSGVNNSRELDEGDDVDDDDLIDANTAQLGDVGLDGMRVLDEDYDEDDDGVGVVVPQDAEAEEDGAVLLPEGDDNAGAVVKGSGGGRGRAGIGGKLLVSGVDVDFARAKKRGHELKSGQM